METDRDTTVLIKTLGSAHPFPAQVTWGFERDRERDLVGGLLGDPTVFSGTTSAAERVEAHDTLTYTVPDGSPQRGRSRTFYKNDVIRLVTDDPLEKFTLAYALAQSAKRAPAASPSDVAHGL